MIHRIRIVLDQVEFDELVRLSLKELRAPADQVRHILRQALIIPDPKPETKQATAPAQTEACYDAKPGFFPSSL